MYHFSRVLDEELERHKCPIEGTSGPTCCISRRPHWNSCARHLYIHWRVLKSVAVCCSVLQCVAVCCSVFRLPHWNHRVWMCDTHIHLYVFIHTNLHALYFSVLQCVAVSLQAPASTLRTMCVTFIYTLFCNVLQYVAMCVLPCVAMCCSVLQCAAVCCSVLQHFAVSRQEQTLKTPCVASLIYNVLLCVAVCYIVLQCVAACCSVLQCVAASHQAPNLTAPCVASTMRIYLIVCCSLIQCVAVFCNVWQYGAVCCSVLQCVAMPALKNQNALKNTVRGILYIHIHTHMHTYVYICTCTYM